MMTAYVILSRIKSVDGLLLLRAFAPDLFRMGPVAGPHCLIKLLRARLLDSSTYRTYTCTVARQEYAHLVEVYEAWRASRRSHGTSWVCAECKHPMPAEEYGAKISCTDDVHRVCMAPGQWRKCRSCTQKDEESKDKKREDEHLQYCRGCDKMRDDCCFTFGINPFKYSE